MSQARKLLDDLAVIGATVEPSGTQLILRAGPTAIPGVLVRRVREAKSDLIAMLSSGSKAENAISEQDPADIQEESRSEARLIHWLDEHPAPSPEGACVWCGKLEAPHAVVLPFGVQPGTHAWLHAECWPAWHQARRAEARRELIADWELG